MLPGCNMTECIELVVYEIKAEAENEFKQIRVQLINELKSLPGFVSYKTFQATSNPQCFTDQVIWSDDILAKQAFMQFKQLKNAKGFMQCIDKVLFANHFKEYALS
jgi:hypothetical protein